MFALQLVLLGLGGTPPSVIPAFEARPGAANWPVASWQGEPPASVVGVLAPAHTDVPAGLWLRALTRGEREAERAHLLAALAAEGPSSDCPRGGGHAVSCTVRASVARSPMIAAAGPDRLIVAWIRRETTRSHALSASDRGPTGATQRSVSEEDVAAAVEIHMSDGQWRQGPARLARLGQTLALDARPSLRVRKDDVSLRVGERSWPLVAAQPSWSGGPLPSRSALPRPSAALVCEGGQVDCGGRCTDLSRDRRNCGACGVSCGDARCDAGRCGPFCYTDAQCKGKVPGFPNARCMSPRVQRRGTPGPGCEGPGTCGEWGRCVDGVCQPRPCARVADCPQGDKVRCVRLPGGSERVCVPRGQCVGPWQIPGR